MTFEGKPYSVSGPAEAIKAGILEIGDIFNINKADRDGVDRLNVELEMMLDLNQDMVDWRPPIKRTVAHMNQGITELVATIDEHITHLTATGKLEERRLERTRNELLAMLDEQLGRYVLNKVNASGKFDEMVNSVQQRKQDPYSVVNGIISGLLR
jgi:LAO/AO transport system kinase